MSFLTKYVGGDSRSGSLGILSELETMHVDIDYYVMRLGPQTWGIRGHIAYDGEVLAATFPSEHEAWIALAPVAPEPRT